MRSSIAMLFGILLCSFLSSFAQNIDEYHPDVLPKYSARTPFRHRVDGYEEKPVNSEYSDEEGDEDAQQNQMDFRQRPTGYPDPEIDSSRPVGRGSEQSGDELMPHNRKAKIVGVDMHMVAGIYPENQKRMADESSGESESRSTPPMRPHARERMNRRREEEDSEDMGRHPTYKKHPSEKSSFEFENGGLRGGRQLDREENDSEDTRREYLPIDRHQRPYPYMERNHQEFIPRNPKHFRVPYMRERFLQEDRRDNRRQHQKPWEYGAYRPFQVDSNESYESNEEEQLPKPVKPHSQRRNRERNEEYHPYPTFFSHPRYEPFQFQDFDNESDFKQKSSTKTRKIPKASASNDSVEHSKSESQHVKPERFEPDFRRRNDGANSKNRKEDISTSKNMGPEDDYTDDGQRMGDGNSAADTEKETSKYHDDVMEPTTNSSKLILPTNEPLQSNSTVSDEKVKVM